MFKGRDLRRKLCLEAIKKDTLSHLLVHQLTLKWLYSLSFIEPFLDNFPPFYQRSAKKKGRLSFAKCFERVQDSGQIRSSVYEFCLSLGVFQMLAYLFSKVWSWNSLALCIWRVLSVHRWKYEWTSRRPCLVCRLSAISACFFTSANAKYGRANTDLSQD